MIASILLILAQDATSIDAADDLRKSERVDTEFFVGEKFAEEARRTPQDVLRKTADDKLALWRACLKEFSSKASFIDSDPTPVVVDIAFKACRTERSNAEWAWAQATFVSSRFKPKMLTAHRWAREAFDEFSDSSSQDLQVSVSYERQIRYLKNEASKFKVR